MAKKTGGSERQNPGKGLWAVFLFSLTVAIISTIPVLFPASLTLTESQIPEIGQNGPDRLETGVWTGGVIAANMAVFGMLILHYKKKLPLSGALRRFFSFEISKKKSYVVVSIIVGMYAVSSAGEISTEDEWADYANLKNRLQSWSVQDVGVKMEPHVKYAITNASMAAFGNYAVLPYIASILLVILTYIITVQITGKRFSGIIAVIVLLQSNTFLTYDTSVTYTNFWTVLFLASLYFARKAWPAAPAVLVLSVFSKALTAMFVPMSIYYYMRTDMKKGYKAALVAVTAGIVIAGSIAVYSGPGLGEARGEGFDSKEFWAGFSSFANQLRWDGIVLMFLIPLIAGLFIASRCGIRHADSIMIMIAGMLMIAPVLAGFTNQTNQPYRFVPLVVFFAIGVGILLSEAPIRYGQKSR